MISHSRGLAICTSALALIAASSLPSAAAEPRCLAKVDSVLDKLGIAEDRRREISVVSRIVTTRDGSYVAGYDAWVRLESCRGAVIVDMRRNCAVKQTYTRGDCAVEGLKAF